MYLQPVFKVITENQQALGLRDGTESYSTGGQTNTWFWSFNGICGK